ncbi:lipase family alpha/beta hydrolase [Bradyrhizobium sp. HKCCYLRH3099]|uniref:lipase family alpha/beta hydrolase n=1 Tax=unclassified Bradyrhizobium TaxID=2631580 RepID=UPI003EBDC848
MDIYEAFLKASTLERLALVRDDANSLVLSRLLGAAAYREMRQLARHSHDTSHLAPGDAKNVVFVPGVMGSLLMNSTKGGIWWIDVRTRNYIDNLGLSPDGSSDADPTDRVVPATADPSYTPFLSAAIQEDGISHEIFSYDWRKPLLLSADALRDLIVRMYQSNGQKKVHLVAHSMGGLMVRTALMQHASVLWPIIGKVIFIGTPHYGSPAIAGYLKNHLWGFELMALLGRYLSRSTLRSLWGVLSMLPAPRGIYPGTREHDPCPWTSAEPHDPFIHPCANFDLHKADAWKLDLDPTSAVRLQRVLDGAMDFHRRLYEAHRNLDQQQRDQMVVIAGVGQRTLFRLANQPGFAGLWDKTDKVLDRVLDNPHREGDGRVSLASALLENVGETRYVFGVHGGLTNIEAVYSDVFRCLKDLPLQLPSTVADALSSHLAGPSTSSAPHLDGTHIVESGSEEEGIWNLTPPSTDRMDELDSMLAVGQLPDFARLHLL